MHVKHGTTHRSRSFSSSSGAVRFLCVVLLVWVLLVVVIIIMAVVVVVCESVEVVAFIAFFYCTCSSSCRADKAKENARMAKANNTL